MTKKKAMDKIFFRFYDIPRENYLLALYGAEWKRKYGSEGESLHFHNHLEVGYCYEGEGVIRLENGELPYFPQIFTLIPKNCPHAIQGEGGSIIGSFY
ncbi:MAG: AraC family ligand binding domain-containing protein [Blautia sp.]